MRLFIAVNFSDAVRDAIQSAIDDFPVDRPPWRWSARPTWHLTLKFLGERPDWDVDALAAVLADAAAQYRPIDMTLDRLGAFPNLKRPRVLFYDVAAGRDELSALARDVDTTLHDRLGIEREAKPFKAHTTVARIKERLPGGITRKLEAAPGLGGVSQTVGNIDLMESRLSRQGAQYQCLKQFALSEDA